MVNVINKDTFEAEVLKADMPVMVDFFATWCGPCKMLSPILEEISEERADIKVCKINVDDCPELADKYGINAIPAVFCFKGGEAASNSVGYKSKGALLSSLGL